MPTTHPELEELDSFAKGQLHPGRWRSVERHVMACQPCAARVEEQLDREGADLQRYDPAFRRMLERIGVIERQIAADRQNGRELWARIRMHPPGRRLTIIQSARRFATPGVLDALLAEYRRTSRQTDDGMALAELGVVLAMRLDARVYGHTRITDLQVEALGAAGNACSMAGLPQKAADYLGQAEALVDGGSGDPLLEGDLLTYQGAFWLSVQRFGWAERSFRAAEGLYREAGDLALVARSLVHRAEAVGFLVPGKGIRLAERALRELLAAQERWSSGAGPGAPPKRPSLEVQLLLDQVELAARHHLAWFLDMVGLYGPARRKMQEASALYGRFTGDAIPTFMRVWLKGRIERSHDELEAAGRSFALAWAGLEELGMSVHLTLLAVDRAELDLMQGASRAAAGWLAQVMAPLRALGERSETLWILERLHDSVIAGTVDCAAFRRVFVAIWRTGCNR